MGMMQQMGKGMPGMGMRPQMMQQRPQMPRPQGMPGADGQISAAQLAATPPGMQKQIIGEKIHGVISRQYPDLAGKITGMMLEMDNAELLHLLEDQKALDLKVDEARRVLGAL